MENQSMNDQLIDNLEYYDFDIDYGFLNEILNSETQEDNQIVDSNYFDISELDDLIISVDDHRGVSGNHHQNNGKEVGWVKRRKFEKGTLEYALWKQEMKLKNRVSARRSIEKKEAYMRELEGKIQRLRAENEFRRRVLEIFPNSKPAGSLSGLRRAFSTSDFYVTNQVAAEEEVGMYL